MSQIEAIAEFVLTNADYSELYEDDCFTVEVQGQRAYVERRRAHFAIHFDNIIHKVPRS